MASLDALGYCVLRLPDALFEAFDVAAFLGEQLEFEAPTAATPQVMGGFGALGNPTSFHHRALRRFRSALYRRTLPLFCAAFPGQHLQCVPDRFSVRRAGTALSPEAWHRDVSVPPGTGLCFGGWANLDAPGAEPQVLSCAPATHRDEPGGAAGSGFAPLSPEELLGARARRRRVEVPPRHCVVFHERLVHEVAARRQTGGDSYRLYAKYLVTPDAAAAPFGSEILDRLRDLGVPPYHVALRGGGKKRRRRFEYPKMYANNHVTNNNKPSTKPHHRIEAFSAALKAPFKARVRAGLANAGKEWVFRTLPSLTQAGLADSPLVPAYSARELAWFAPRPLGAAILAEEEQEEEDVSCAGNTVVTT